MNILHPAKSTVTKNSTEEELVFNFLTRQKSGVLATADLYNNPHASVVYYSIDPSFSIRFFTKKKTKKSRNVAHNSHVMFVVYDEMSQTVVQITGRVSEVADEDVTHEAFMYTLRASLDTTSSAVPPIVKIDAGDHVAYMLIPKEIKMVIYNRHHTIHTGESLETINLSF